MKQKKVSRVQAKQALKRLGMNKPTVKDIDNFRFAKSGDFIISSGKLEINWHKTNNNNIQ